MAEALNRRPVKSRDWLLIRKSAQWIARKNISPNLISIASIGFSAFAALCLLALPWQGVMTSVLCFLVIALLAARGLCNLYDGLVAIEGGKSTKSGEMFNDMPDRISDILILVAAGYATDISYAPVLGWCAALMAVMTAYTRTLGRSVGAPSDFQGPMAKMHRMGVIALACFITVLWPSGYVFVTALIIIILGCAITVHNRAYTAYMHLEGIPHD